MLCIIPYLNYDSQIYKDVRDESLTMMETNVEYGNMRYSIVMDPEARVTAFKTNLNCNRVGKPPGMDKYECEISIRESYKGDKHFTTDVYWLLLVVSTWKR